MAKKVIKKTDLAEPGLFDDIKQGAAATLDLVQKLREAIVAIGGNQKGGLKANALGNPEDLRKLTEAMEKIKRLTEDNNRLKQFENDILKAQKKGYEGLTAEKKKLIEANEFLKVATKAYREEAQKDAQLASEQVDAYKKKVIVYDDLQRAAKNLAVTKGMENAETIEAIRLANEEGAALRKIDTALNQHFKNVGNYGNAFNGMNNAVNTLSITNSSSTKTFNGLNNSINQLTREAPAAALSMNTFFLAISNNIPQFTDEIKKLKDANVALEASGKPAVSIAGALAKAFFSWNTAISLGVTLLTLFGGKLIDYIFNTEKATTVTEEFGVAQKELNDRIRKSNEEFEKSNNLANDKVNGEALNREIDFNKKKEEIRNFYQKKEQENRKQLDKESGYRRDNQTLADDLKFTPDKDLAAYIKRKAYNDELLAKELRNASVVFAQNEQKLEDQKNEKKDVKSKERKEKEVKEHEEKFKTFEEITNEEYQIQEQNTKDYFERQKNNADIDFLNGKISLEEYSKLIEKLKLDSLYKQFQDAVDYGQKTVYLEEQISALKVENLKKQLEEEEKLRKDAILTGTDSGKEQARKAGQFREDDKKARINTEKEILDQFIKLNNQYYSELQQKEQVKIDKSKQRQAEYALLAQQGVEDAADNYAFEQKKQAEAEEQKLKLQRQKERTELAIGAFKAYAANNGDINKTIRDLSVLSAAIATSPIFFKGTEDTGAGGKVDEKGGFHAIIHPHERIFNAKQNKRIPKGMSNEVAATILEQVHMITPWNHIERKIVALDPEMRKELQGIKRAIEEKPVPQYKVDWFSIGQGIRETIETEGKKEINIHQGGIWGG